jgi:hypothetical protein
MNGFLFWSGPNEVNWRSNGSGFFGFPIPAFRSNFMFFVTLSAVEGLF